MISFLQFWRPLWNDKGHKTQSAWLGDPSRQETDEETQESPTAWMTGSWPVLLLGSVCSGVFWRLGACLNGCSFVSGQLSFYLSLELYFV
jgi:hypothetical protein